MSNVPEPPIPVDVVLTARIATAVMAAAREHCARMRRPLDPESVEVFGFHDGRPVFKVHGVRTVLRITESKAGDLGGLFGGETVEEVREERFPDFVFVWADQLPDWVPDEFLNPPRAASSGPHIFGRHVREVSHS